MAAKGMSLAPNRSRRPAWWAALWLASWIGAAGAVAAEVPRYEIECRLELDTKNHSVEAHALRVIQQRVRATGALGSPVIIQLLYPEAPAVYRLVARGTTVPKLIERTLSRDIICGWVRSSDTVRGSGRHGGLPDVDEDGPFEIDRWGGGGTVEVHLLTGSESRAVASAAIVVARGSGTSAGSESMLSLTLTPRARGYASLAVAGMLVTADRIRGRESVLLPLPTDVEEQAAILGLVRDAPDSLPCDVTVTEFAIRPLADRGMPPTLTRRLSDLGSTSRAPGGLDVALRDRSPIVRREAVATGASRPSRVSEAALGRALADPDPAVAVSALRTAAASGKKPGVRELGRMAASPDLQLSTEGLRGLMAARTPEATRLALAILRSDERLERALDTMSQTRFTAALPRLEALANRSDRLASIRIRALDAFVTLSPPDRARPLLLRLVGDQDPAVRDEAARRLGLTPGMRRK